MKRSIVRWLFAVGLSLSHVAASADESIVTIQSLLPADAALVAWTPNPTTLTADINRIAHSLADRKSVV